MGWVDPLKEEALLNRIAVAIRDLHDETKVDLRAVAEACSGEKLKWKNKDQTILTAAEVRKLIRDTKNTLGTHATRG